MTPFRIREIRVSRPLPFGPKGQPSAIEKATVSGRSRLPPRVSPETNRPTGGIMAGRTRPSMSLRWLTTPYWRPGCTARPDLSAAVPSARTLSSMARARTTSALASSGAWATCANAYLLSDPRLLGQGLLNAARAVVMELVVPALIRQASEAKSPPDHARHFAD